MYRQKQKSRQEAALCKKIRPTILGGRIGMKRSE
jgi:hypothetical protein